jgi:hypothetical protein
MSQPNQKATLLAGLAGLELQRFVGVAHTFSFVRIGPAKTSHIGSNLAHLLPIRAGYRQRRLVLLNRLVDALDFDVDTRRQRELDLVRVTKVEDHAIFLTLSLVTHADNIKLTQETVGYTGDCVLDQSASEPMHRRAVVRLAFGYQLIAFDAALDAFRQWDRERAFWSGDLNGSVLNLELYALRY